MFKVKIPATTANLGPGFDTFGMSLGLYNLIEIERKQKEGVEIEVAGYGIEELTTDESNLVYRSMLRLFETVDYLPPGLKIKLINRIPLARGLGSSAAAIVGGLLAANKLSGEQLTTEELLNLATEIEGHPDNVAPALLGGVVISTVKDKEVIYKKVTPPSKLKTVVCIPDYQLTTDESRSALPDKVSFKDAVFNVSHASLLLAGLLTEDYELIGQALDDRLHQPYRQGLIPGLDEVIEDLSQDVLGIVLSGSGPTAIALTLEDEERIGVEMKDIFAKQGIEAQYLVISPTDQGATIIES
ncbi:homoserine kinase [Natroniella sulfidigena]|uniref:homoserine kinase n=1 Tax=Natroniella sulfidigena TaxID=723921 RepID=UPI00200B4733|nr:homoserine kinase [Natroniella sulfidigena]MCK8817740.1 homoserine kinase [Natroniella sulfidigena]